MNKLLKINLLLNCILLTAPLSAYATTYYVDATAGKDSNPGTSTSAAWKSLANVNTHTFAAGDSILFKNGQIWREQLTITSSGAPGKPITYGTYGRAASPAQINGSNNIPALSWRPYSGSSNIFVAPVTGLTKPPAHNSIQLYVDDTFYDVAHYPNDGFMLATADAPNQTTLIDSALPLSASQVIGSTVVAKSASWTLDPAPVSGYDPASHTITTATDIRYPMKTGYGYYLRNKLWMLDGPNEWYYDATAGLVYIWLPTGDKPSKHKIEITARNNGVTGGTKSNIVIRGIAISKATAYDVNLQSMNNLTLDQLNVSNTGTGIYTTGSNITISNSTVQNMLNEGIHILGSQNKVASNTVTNVGVVGITPDTTPNSIYVVNGSSYTTVSDNTVTNSGYNGIRFDGPHHTIVRNTVDQSCLKLDDCGGLYTWTGDITNPDTGDIVDSNKVSNSIGNTSGTPFVYTQAQGIYLDDLRHDITVTNNTVTNADYGIVLHNNYNDVVSGNRFYASRRNGIRIGEDAAAQKSGFVHNNLINANVVDVVATALPGNYTSTLGTTSAFATFDKNTYCHPTAGMVITRQNKGQGAASYSLADWRKASGQDMNSTEVIGSCAQ